MRSLIFILTAIAFLAPNTLTAGLPVYDGPRHVTDIIDNIQDLIDKVTQIQHQVEQIEKLSEQITQMDDYLERVGRAVEVKVKSGNINLGDIENILEEIEEYTSGEGLTKAEKKLKKVIFGEIDKITHKTIGEPAPDKKYEKHERVEKEFFAYKKTAESISIKRLNILSELKSLTERLNSAATDQQVQKLNSSINAHKTMLSILKDEEQKQFRAFHSELENKRNAWEKDRTRFEERMRMLNKINVQRPAKYLLTPSSEILKTIEGNK